mmetsp:Transcript_43932/g.102718  ORF Transcript_43932/g.102718 Transcript_43932/m.102718 type:complete len:206 (+) Transcript_43932:1407-2024(+)
MAMCEKVLSAGKSVLGFVVDAAALTDYSDNYRSQFEVPFKPEARQSLRLPGLHARCSCAHSGCRHPIWCARVQVRFDQRKAKIYVYFGEHITSPEQAAAIFPEGPLRKYFAPFWKGPHWLGVQVRACRSLAVHFACVSTRGIHASCAHLACIFCVSRLGLAATHVQTWRLLWQLRPRSPAQHRCREFKRLYSHRGPPTESDTHRG